MPENYSVHIIAGGAGFIGLNLAVELLKTATNNVTLVDNLSNAHTEQLSTLLSNEQYRDRLHFQLCDISNYNDLENAWNSIEKDFNSMDQKVDYTKEAIVWHLAANSDIPSGIEDPCVDLRDTFI